MVLTRPLPGWLRHHAGERHPPPPGHWPSTCHPTLGRKGEVLNFPATCLGPVTTCRTLAFRDCPRRPLQGSQAPAGGAGVPILLMVPTASPAPQAGPLTCVFCNLTCLFLSATCFLRLNTLHRLFPLPVVPFPLPQLQSTTFSWLPSSCALPTPHDEGITSLGQVLTCTGPVRFCFCPTQAGAPRAGLGPVLSAC